MIIVVSTDFLLVFHLDLDLLNPRPGHARQRKGVGMGRCHGGWTTTTNMCNRYLTPSRAEIERHWQLRDAQMRNAPGKPFNALPAAIVPMLHLARNGDLELVAARWGLIPIWWKEKKLPSDTFIAPSEEAAARPIWKIPAGKWRCLVPAMGWYVWKEIERLNPAAGESKRAQQPYFTRLPDRQPFAFAGLMSRRSVEGDQPEFTCTILTRDAVGPIAQIHARMPIVLPKNAHAAWLYREMTDAAVAIEFAREQAVTEFVHHPIEVAREQAMDEVVHHPIDLRINNTRIGDTALNAPSRQAKAAAR